VSTRRYKDRDPRLHDSTTRCSVAGNGPPA